MKALIIGASGFVGGHLIEHLNSIDAVEVFATKLQHELICSDCVKKENIFDTDILDTKQVEDLLKTVQPDYIFHLAAQSSVSLSWKLPALTYSVNVVGTVNLLEAVKKLSLDVRILIVGSAEQYGLFNKEDLPLKEELMVKPSNPYAISKLAQEMTAKMYVSAFNMDIVMVRAFNHIGTGQIPTFVIPDFAKQVAEIEKGLREPVMYVGNLKVKRDFSDVRDIVAGYWLLMQKGLKGEIYNIGSGKSYEIKEMLSKLIELSGREIEVKVDEKKFRPADIEDLYADIRKIQKDTGWSPGIDIHTSLEDILDYWRKKC